MTIQVLAYNPFQVEELLKPGMPEKFIEVIEGELVMMAPASRDYNKITSAFQKLFDQFCAARPELDFGFDNDGFLLRRNPDLLLCPDASLFTRRPQSEGVWMEFAPEIVVEVLSPSNTPSESALKRSKYFDAGVEQVWIARPKNKSLEFCFRDGRCMIFQGNEVAPAEGIAEGLGIDLQMIFGSAAGKQDGISSGQNA